VRFRYYRHHKDFLAFAYTTQRDDKGKFYAIKYRIKTEKGQELWNLVKRIPFGRRKKATERAYKWFVERRKVLEKIVAKKAALPPKQPPSKADILQKKLSKVQDSLKRLETKKKRLETLIKKRKRQEAYYQKQLKI